MRIEVKLDFSDDDYVVYKCPSCNNLSLKVDVGNFKSNQTLESIRDEHDEYANLSPDEFYFATFIGTLQCENPHCKAVVSCSGESYIELDYSDYREQRYMICYRPKVFLPHLVYFPIPKDTPTIVKSNLNEAFSLTLFSPSSAATKVRAAIETLLDSKFGISSKDENDKFISLEKRLNIFKEDHPKLYEIFSAIRWIGNEGSHGVSSLKEKDIFEAYEFMHHALHEIYEPSSQISYKASLRIENKGKSNG